MARGKSRLEQKIAAATCKAEGMIAINQEKIRLRNMVLDLFQHAAYWGIDDSELWELLALIDAIQVSEDT